MPTPFRLKVSEVVENINMKTFHCRPNVSIFQNYMKILTNQFYKHELIAELIRNKPGIFALQFAAIIDVNLTESISVILSQSTRAKFSFFKFHAPSWTNMLNLSFESNAQEVKIYAAGTNYSFYTIILKIYTVLLCVENWLL